MGERIATTDEAAAALATLAGAEADSAPFSARLCSILADDPRLADLLLVPPTGQRLPTLLLAALHDTVLADPTVSLARWYPSVGGDPDATGDLARALRATVERHGGRIREVLSTRSVQTNEVNRSIAWVLALAELERDGRIGSRPLALVELGASAGLNLLADLVQVELVDRCSGVRRSIGRSDADLVLTTDLRSDWPDLPGEPPGFGWRRGLDLRPVDVDDPQAVRWLTACTWAEQVERRDRLAAAVERARRHGAEVRSGDVVDDLAPLLAEVPPGHDVVVTSSWTLVYLARPRRAELLDVLRGSSAALAGRGSALHLLAMEAPEVLPWVGAPALAEDDPASRRHASVISITSVVEGTVRARPIARAQAHLDWVERLAP